LKSLELPAEELTQAIRHARLSRSKQKLNDVVWLNDDEKNQEVKNKFKDDRLHAPVALNIKDCQSKRCVCLHCNNRQTVAETANG